MKYEDYKQFVKDRWVSSHRTREQQISHAAMGLGGEAGEVVDWCKKDLFHDHREMDREDLVKEIGDVLYYATRLMDLYGISLEEALQSNVEKITERYDK